MKNFDWEEFKKGKTVVHCDTEEKAKDFVKKCHEHNLKWYNPDNNSTYYNFINTYRYDVHLTGATLDYYKDLNYKAINWEIEEMTNTEKILDVIGLKVGEKFKVNNDTFYFDKELRLYRDEGILSYLELDVLNGYFKIIKLPTITDNDKEILNFYAKRGYKWFACDKDGTQKAYAKKPERVSNVFMGGKCNKYQILFDKLSFPKWEDVPFYWECE